MYAIITLAAVLTTWVDGTTADPGFQILGYDLELSIDPDASPNVVGTARVEVRATRALDAVSFSLNDRLRITGVEDGKRSATVAEGRDLREGRELRIELSPRLQVDQTRRLTLTYAGDGMDPGADGPDWMGILLVRDDEIRMSHQAQWYPVVPLDDAVVAKMEAPIDLSLELPRGMESLGPGVLVRKKGGGRGRERHIWRMERSGQGSIVAGRHRVIERGKGRLEVRALAFSGHEAGAGRWADETLEALRGLQRVLGGPQAAHYGIAEMHVRNRSRSYNYEADGFSVYDSVLFDGRDPDPRKVAHEVGHRWFGGIADAVGPGERFLTESLAEFAAWLYLEDAYGKDAAVTAAASAQRSYRSGAGEEASLATAGFGSPRYSACVYAKGPLTLRTLESWIGADAVRAALRTYVAASAESSGSPTLESFRDALQAADSAVIDAWWEECLERSGAPCYRVELAEDRKSGWLFQEEPLYHHPIELELRVRSGAATHVVLQPTARSTPFALTGSGEITEVVIDPASRVAWTP